MATQPDYYSILQVHPRAEKEVIDAAYRRLASKYHPDVSQVSGALERMKQINTAYDVLSDPIKRAAYDSARGFVHPEDTPSHAPIKSRHPTNTWRTLLIAASLMLITVVALRLGPAVLLAGTKLVVLLVVISMIVWLLFNVAKPRR